MFRVCQQIIDIHFQNLTKHKDIMGKSAAKSCNVKAYGECRVNSVIYSAANHNTYKEKLRILLKCVIPVTCTRLVGRAKGQSITQLYI
jgi:hypothetical protein